jgi:tetratricopeptide (TPR) repeat protein
MKAGVLAIVLAILLMPISQGVHFGPRLLLFAVPLLVIAVYQSGRMKGAAWYALVALKAVQVLGGSLLVYARANEMDQRLKLAEPRLGSIVACATASQCADLAPLWDEREFFVASSPRELKQFLIEMRAQEIDTVWLHLDAFDSMYVLAFPGTQPLVRPYRMTVIQATGLYTTWWRIYELVLNRKDPQWGAVLEEEAGYLVGDGRMESALNLQIQATELQPDSARSHSNLAVLYSHLGQREEAEREARLAIELNPNLQEPRRLLEILTGSRE